MYLASSHHDKEHIHLHIVMSSTKLITGELNRISRQEFRDLKLADESIKRKVSLNL
ncbi:MAG: relaxase/mobilization nuclease domain-containing protein [Bacteroidetes bacterium]|nr:relaxase/mobilization nuclease domain-containing protein [Bacteroidota bacterium]